MAQAYSWDRMLEEFRQLGGTADNVVQRQGGHGNGIFAVDPTQPVGIRVPARLLVDVKHVVLDGDDLVVDPAAGVPAEVCDFFSRYQRHFSWGAAGRRDVEAFEKSLQGLPEALRDRLKALALLDLEQRHQGEWAEVLKTWFLNSRKISYKGHTVVMPVVELVNHSPKSRGFKVEDDISVEGVFEDEVTVNYSVSDSLRRFFTYGFASQEPVAFSLPVLFSLRGGPQVQVSNLIDTVIRAGNLPAPKVEEKGNRRILSHLRLGSEGSPRLPKTLMRKALPDLPAETADEVFERIRSANIGTLCDLLDLAEGAESCGPLRRAIVCQLRALSHCHGVRADGA